MKGAVGIKIQWSTFFFAVFTAFAVVVGKAVYADNSVNALVMPVPQLGLTIVKLIGCSVFFYLIYMGLAKLLLRFGNTAKQDGQVSGKTLLKVRIVSGIVIFLLDMLVLLAYYPGIFSYDIIIQTDQALGIIPMDRFHPPLHTYFWKICLMIGGRNADSLQIAIERGITVYGIVQAFFYAYVLSGLIRMVWRASLHKVWKWVLTVFCLFHPLILIFSIIPTKDALFAVFFAQMTGRLYEELQWKYTDSRCRRRFRHIFLVLDVLLCCLLRNNAIYVMILMVVVLLIGILRKEDGEFRRILAGVFAGAVIMYFVINGLIYNALGIGGGDLREALSLPLQQMAHTYISEGESMPEDMVSELNRFLPVEQLNQEFNYRLADYVKGLADKEELEQHKADFLKLYIRLFLKYPDNYMNEFLAMHVSSWYPLADGVDAVSGRDYIETYLSEYPLGQPVRNSRFPWLLSVLEEVACYRAFDRISVVRYFFSMAAPIWGIFIGMYLLRIQGKREQILLCLPALFLWMTYLAGPVTCMRYLFPIVLVLPVIALAIFENTDSVNIEPLDTPYDC